LIELQDRLVVDRVDKLCKSHTFTSTVVSITASSVKICTLAATVGVEVECRGASGASRHFSTPSGSARVRSVGFTVHAANLVV
jgi:hypothetical protein